MKLTNKRLVSILLCLAMVLAMLPMAVFAATDYYLRGSMNGWGADDSNKMTDNGDGTYSITMDLAAGDYEFKGAIADWTWSCPSSNMAMSLSAADTVTFVLNPSAYTLTYTLASGAEPEVPVVENVTLYCNAPADWTVCYCYWWGSTVENPEWSGKEMTKGSDGIWYIDVPADADNVIFNNGSAQSSDLPMPTDDNVQYNYEAKTWGTYGGTVVEPDPMVIESVYAVGAGSGNFLYGAEWDPASGFNVMEGVDNVYTITYMGVAAGTYEYKFAANGTWDISWGAGCETVSGETYDAWFNGSNNVLNVAKDGSTVTLILDLSAMNFVTGEGAKCQVVVEEPAVSSAPEAMVLGSNDFSIAAGDTNAVSSTYVVEEAGFLSVTPSAMTTPDGEVPAEYIAMQFGRMYALLVNGEQVWLPCEIEVAAGDVVEIGVMSYMGAETSVTIDLAIREPGVNDIKWQVPVVSTENDESVDLRLVSWVDTLDYSNVQFTVTIGEYTGTLDVTTVYETIYGEAFATYTPAGVFGDDANYFVTHTITGIPAAYFNEEIEVTATWYDLDGNVVKTSETRTIVIADNWG